MKKTKGKWVQVGNFLLGVEKASTGNRIVARSVFGDWRLMWEQGCSMYALMLNFMRDEKTHNYLHALLALQYSATNYPHDMVALVEKGETPFINGFIKLLNEQTDFEVSVKKAASKEVDEEALNEVSELQEVSDELEKLDAEKE